jgi:hypothetical protein
MIHKLAAPYKGLLIVVGTVALFLLVWRPILYVAMAVVFYLACVLDTSGGSCV